MSNHPSNDPHLRRVGVLCAKLSEADLTDDERAELIQRLGESDQARAYYLKYLHLHTQLAAQWGVVPSHDRPANPRHAGFVFSPRAMTYAWAASIALTLSLAAWLAWQQSRYNNAPSAQPSIAGEVPSLESAPQDFDPQDGGYVELARFHQSQTQRSTAVVVHAHAVDAKAIRPGKRLGEGVLRFETGVVQLEFMSGTTAAIAGPAELHLTADNSLTLVRGRATVHVPRRAREFVLNTPCAAIVDRDTRFQIQIDSSGTSELSVVEGEVHLSVLGDDGYTLTSRRVPQSTAIRIDSQTRSLVELPAPSDLDAMPRILPANDLPLHVPPQYADAVLLDRPVLYWRFNESGQIVTKNEVDGLINGTLQRSDDDPDAVQLIDGHARFRRSPHPRTIVSDDALEDLNGGPFTIEMWIRPDDLSHSTCMGIVPQKSPRGSIHLNVIEIVTESEMIHEPGSFRFLHRWPPSQLFQDGINTFTQGLCTPGQWRHIVAVKAETHVAFYVNGRPLRKVPLENGDGDGDFLIILGQLRTHTPFRQFAGSIDEFAIYPGVLSDERIDEHFRLIESTNDLH